MAVLVVHRKTPIATLSRARPNVPVEVNIVFLTQSTRMEPGPAIRPMGTRETGLTGRGGNRRSNPHNGGPHNWRDLLVRSAHQRSIIH